MKLPLLFFLTWCALSALGTAQENPLRVELVAQESTIQPGHPFRVALRLQHPAGYHSYWKFAGIVGLPTDIQWKLPPGWSAGAIEWPAPERVMMFQIKAQGFYGERLLPVLLTPPADLAPGQRIKLEAKARWMCCGPNCNPGFKDLSLELPISADAPALDARWSELFKTSAASVARDCSDWTARAELKNGEVVFHLVPLSAAAKAQMARITEVNFFTEDGLTDSNRPERFTREEGGLVLTQTISEFAPSPLPKEVAGVLQATEGWLPGTGAIRILIPLSQ